MSGDRWLTQEQAMERVYNSPLMPSLQDEEGELYVQSPAYLYELMNQFWIVRISRTVFLYASTTSRMEAI